MLISVFVSLAFFAPIGLGGFLSNMFHMLAVFCLPISFDASTMTIANAFLRPIITTDYFGRVELIEHGGVPSRYREVGVPSDYILTAIFPAMILLLSTAFKRFLRIQVAAQQVVKATASRFKVFFFFAREDFEDSGHLSVVRAFYPQLLFCALLYIYYYDAASGSLNLFLPACTFIYCLSVIVQFFMTFTYHIAETKPSKKDIEEMRFRRSLLMDSGFEKRQLVLPEVASEVDIKEKLSLRKNFAGTATMSEEQKKVAYESLDFQAQYRKKLRELQNKVITDYEIESLKFPKSFRPILAGSRTESYWARICPLFELLHTTVFTAIIITLPTAIFLQLGFLMTLEFAFILYVWQVRVYNNKKSFVFALTNRVASLLMLAICAVLAADSKQQMMSKFTRYRVIDRGVLQHILVLMILFNSCFSIYMIKDRFVKVYRFFFDKKYLAVLSSMLYASSHSDFTYNRLAKE